MVAQSASHDHRLNGNGAVSAPTGEQMAELMSRLARALADPKFFAFEKRVLAKYENGGRQSTPSALLRIAVPNAPLKQSDADFGNRSG